MSIEHIASGHEVMGSPQQVAHVNWISVASYILPAFGISWGIWLPLRALGVPWTIYAAIGMIGRALAAVIVRLVRHEGFSDAGLRLVGRGVKKGGWMYLVAYVSIPLVLAVGMALALLTGVQHWAFAANLHQTGVATVAA